MSVLELDVFVVPYRPIVAAVEQMSERETHWPAISNSLISGTRDAVLVDKPLLAEDAQRLVAWIQAKEKNLTTHDITHGHGDDLATRSSWINLVERWFSELTTKMLKRGAHQSVRQLNGDICNWLDTGTRTPARTYGSRPPSRSSTRSAGTANESTRQETRRSA
jgi:hypothetical protein